MRRIGSLNGGGAIRRAVTIDYRMSAADALAHVDRSLNLLDGLVRKGGDAGCELVALPEDCLGLAGWEGAHLDSLADLLPEAEARLQERLGRTAAEFGIYLVAGTETLDADGAMRNSALLFGRDGRELGRYHKVNLPVHEQLKRPGDSFPVFATPELGGIGMLICYDMIFPESARCLALGGAHLIVDPTEGGAAFGGPELSRAAYRTRAVENFTYIVVSWGGWGETEGSLVISPRGEILAEELRPGELAIADIDSFGDRATQDWSNGQTDMRARLFRERRPDAFGVLTDPTPPVLDTLPPLEPGPAQEIARMVSRATTVGHGQFAAAEAHRREGRIDEARAAYAALLADYPGTWFAQTARARLAEL